MDAVQVTGLMAIALIFSLLDVNILIFTTVLIILGLFIDFLVYVNSAPVPLPYEREHFIKSSIKATVKWIGWVIVFWLLYTVLCAAGCYLGLPFFDQIARYAGTILLTTVIYYDIRKLKYTRFYYFKPIQTFVNLVCYIIGCDDEQDITTDKSGQCK